jgi:hypothetical protein
VLLKTLTKISVICQMYAQTSPHLMKAVQLSMMDTAHQGIRTDDQRFARSFLLRITKNGYPFGGK